MQIVIDIPKECIPTRQDVMYIQLHFVDGKVVEASGYGFAVLPKHGRLIDADELNEQEIPAIKKDGVIYVKLSTLQDLIDNAPTIIEADKEQTE